MTGRLITDQAEFNALCERMRAADTVAFDTEFISESHYRPQLCLLQFAVAEELAAVDPFEVKDLSAWWEVLTNDTTTVIVHGGREEIRFCVHAARQKPRRLVDVQVAEGLLSRGYPLSYKALVDRTLKIRISTHETRTDWSRRPLSPKQIEYALEDVEYLIGIWEKQRAQLDKLGRMSWAAAEFERLIDDVASERSRDTYHRVSGIQKLSRKELAFARELYNWRRDEAERLDKPARSVLRDDLLIDLARRQPKTLKEFSATRDLQRRNYQRVAPKILHCIETAAEVPESEWPQKVKVGQGKPQNDVLGRFLGIALADRCAQLRISLPLVGTSADLQDLVNWDLGGRKGSPPRLMQNWRADVCGTLLTDLLEGRVALRVADVNAEAPLVFEKVSSESSAGQ